MVENVAQPSTEPRVTETGTAQRPYTGPVPDGAGVAGVTLWDEKRREEWFASIDNPAWIAAQQAIRDAECN